MTSAIPVQRKLSRALHRYLLQYFFIVFLFYILKNTPLCVAAKNGHTDIVRLLIENGADVNEGERVRLKDKLYLL